MKTRNYSALLSFFLSLLRRVRQTHHETRTRSPNWLQHEEHEASDITAFLHRLNELGPKCGFIVRTIGHVGADPILLLTRSVSRDRPHLLVAAGFHGDEPAGCWGILRFLQREAEGLQRACNLSFLPLVNPSGFRLKTRKNRWDEDPNRGFCHNHTGKPMISREGLLFVENLGYLKELALDGFLSLHEDLEFDKFYIYTFEEGDSPGALSEALKAAEIAFFQPYPDGPLEGGMVRDGIIFKFHDGSFEDLLYHEGTMRTACTETPGTHDINVRVEANAKLIDAFVRFAISDTMI